MSKPEFTVTAYYSVQRGGPSASIDASVKAVAQACHCELIGTDLAASGRWNRRLEFRADTEAQANMLAKQFKNMPGVAVRLRDDLLRRDMLDTRLVDV